MATAARNRSNAASLAYYRARANELEAKNAELWDFVENVANANMAGWASSPEQRWTSLSTEAQEMVRNRESE